ncbi:hypothetical protein R1A27_22350 [Methylobacterium sp. NMS12]|uniref:hypothetical protein n=1 Tax=Methylobacterium sp. NMS12 TaxID=3079766 RepID=UPI003F8830C3
MIALYALLLQAFLGLATPARAWNDPAAMICAGHASGDPADPVIHVHPCCTVVQAGALALPTIDATAWPAAPATRSAWRPESENPTTGPPATTGTARGPPKA